MAEATKQTMTSEDQRKMLGNVRRRPVQIDLLTGNLVPKKIKIARGDNHIRLKSEPGEKSRVPGMAHFAGTGPEDKRCQHCKHLADIPVWRRDCSTPQMAGYGADREPKRIELNACRKACEMYEGRVQRGGLEYESACKYFEER